MNAILLIMPLLFVRFGVLGMVHKDALQRAALFAPVQGVEKVAYFFYQLSNIALVIYPFFLKMQMQPPLFVIAFLVYIIGIVVLVISSIHFGKPEQSGMNTGGIYKVSRNPMYMGYFIYFLGCVLLTRSVWLFVLWLIFVVSSHGIIRSEERWCMDKFGAEYLAYMKRVRRYF